jgi:DNA-binding winged helix-turn-helix (wHTH) protein
MGRDDDLDRTPERALVPSDQQALARLPERDRALLTPDVVARWTGGLAPDDYLDPVEIVRLERGRQRTLQTIREGAELTDLEFKLLRYFQRNERRTLTYQQMAHHLWGTSARPITAYMLRSQMGYASPYIRHIWVLVSSIRQKLEIDPLRPQHLATIRGVGYRWYNDPPSLDDGENYQKRLAESETMRAQVRYDFGYSVEDDVRVLERPRSGPMLGPNHPAYEADVTERRSVRHDP